MGASGNPAKKSQQISSVADFKKRVRITTELPSGLVVQLHNPGGLRLFMQNGTIPNSLMPAVKEGLDSGQSMSEQTVKDLATDEAAIADMMVMMDSITLNCIKQPRVYPLPDLPDDAFEGATPEDYKDEELLYVDEISDEDKMFIFQWVSGGTTDIERFREKQAGNVASLAGQPKVVDSTE